MKTIFIVLYLAASLSMLSCGSMKSDELSSRVSPDTIESTDKPLAICNGGSSEQIKVNLKAAYSLDGKWNPDRVYVKLNLENLTGFESGARYIQFLREMDTSSGTRNLDSSKLRFRLVDLKSTPIQSISDWKTTLGWSGLQTQRTNMGLDDLKSFFEHVGIEVELKDTTGEWDILHTLVYKTGTNELDQNVELLVPIFFANPADFATESDGSAKNPHLMDLHPLKGQTMSSTEFKSQMEAYCVGFAP